MLGEIYLAGFLVALPVMGVLVSMDEKPIGPAAWLATTVMSAVMWPLMVCFALLGRVGEVGDA